jgi:hypothetical protein
MNATWPAHIFFLNLVTQYYLAKKANHEAFSTLLLFSYSEAQTPRDHILHKIKKLWEELVMPAFLWYDTDRIENDASNKSSIFASVFVVAVKFLI